MIPVTEDQVREVVRGLNDEAIAEATRIINAAPFSLERIRGMSRRVERIALSDFPPHGSNLGKHIESIDIYGRRVWLTFHIKDDRRTTAQALHASGAPTIAPAKSDESRHYGETGMD